MDSNTSNMDGVFCQEENEHEKKMTKRKIMNQTDETQSLLTIDELEQLFKLHRRTIWRLCAAGRFPRPIVIGGSNRWKRVDVDRFVDEHTDVRDR